MSAAHSGADAEVKIKLCGLMRPADIDTANTLLPDYIGFVFAPKSKRYVSPVTAAQLKARLDRRIQAVGVFVDAPAAFVAELLEQGILDAAQLHGHENADYIDALRQKTKKPLIQAFRIETAADIARAESSRADFVLLDNGAGGTGQAFDWALLKDVTRPYFLAGGLDADNVSDVQTQYKCIARPYALDVSSGIETHGCKDPEKMRAFVTAVRRAPAGQ